jgi:hypothetical protein
VHETAAGRTTYSWDLENMCSGIVLPDDSRNTFAYDADLRGGSWGMIGRRAE